MLSTRPRGGGSAASAGRRRMAPQQRQGLLRTIPLPVLLLVLLVAAAALDGCSAAVTVGKGSWKVIVKNAGVSAMHMAVVRSNKVVMLDRTDFGQSQMPLPGGRCRNNPADLALKVDCTAHSIELDIGTNRVRALDIFSDTWCSSGYFTADGTLVSTGGFNDGERKVRRFDPGCGAGPASCDWEELGSPALAQKRWYATDQVMPDGRALIVGGTGVFSYEFLPPAGAGAVELPFLRATYVPGVENNLYPFVHLAPDGTLFVFANNRSVLLDVAGASPRVVRTFPDLPSGGAGGGRNYPSTGSSVMLPLRAADRFRRMEVLVCGGAPAGAFRSARRGVFVPALDTCGRLVVTDPAPQWEIEKMPMPRLMGDMLNLPTGDVLILNGCAAGAAGWGLCRTAVRTPVLYQPGQPAGQRFQTLKPSGVARVYHSTAVLLPDARVLVGGSNTHETYVFTGDFPTELRLEAYSPWYLAAATTRPAIAAVSAVDLVLGKSFKLFFTLPPAATTNATGTAAMPAPADLQITLYAPPFNTHSYSMGQRQLLLSFSKLRRSGGAARFAVNVKAPPSTRHAPPGYYYLFVVHKGVPSRATWVRVP